MKTQQVQAHVAPWKKEEVQQLIKVLQQYKVIGIVDMMNLPSSQLQKMRSTLQSTAMIRMTKMRLLKLALEHLNTKIKGLADLEKNLQGMPALICTNENPFSLAKTLRKAKSKAAAKPGQKAPYDILIQAGPTPFAPGPVIGELGQLGLKTQIQEGKIHIKEDKILVHEGEVISAPVSSMLARLSIEPMEIGLNLVAVLENGMVFLKNVLDVDDSVYLQNIKNAAAAAFALAFSISYPTKDNIKLLIEKAARDAKALAESRSILTSEKAHEHVSAASGVSKAVAEQLEGYTPDTTSKQPEEDKKKPENGPVTTAQAAPAPSPPPSAPQASKPIPEPTPQAAPPTPEQKFKEEERAAQDVLKKLQDAKLKEAQKPRWAL